jgi:hypothetical protein
MSCVFFYRSARIVKVSCSCEIKKTSLGIFLKLSMHFLKKMVCYLPSFLESSKQIKIKRKETKFMKYCRLRSYDCSVLNMSGIKQRI